MNNKVKALLVLIVICGLIVIYPFFEDRILRVVNNLPTSTPTPSPSITPKALNEAKLWSAVQNWRQDSNLQTYVPDNNLCTIAQERLTEIKANWSHEGFYEDKYNFWIAENLGKNFYTETELLNSWLDSPSHRKNLDANYKYSCIQTDGLYAVQIFANY